MHTPRPFYPMYSAHPHMMMPHHGHEHGFCHSCCHPAAKCCCGHRGCRKEAKELLVSGTAKATDTDDKTNFARVMSHISSFAGAAAAADEAPVDTEKAFLGGGCCVHLSVEYAPNPAGTTSPGAVILSVADSEQTYMIWGKIVKVGSLYTIKECVISTQPGSTLTVAVLNATARVRWCEVFSC